MSEGRSIAVLTLVNVIGAAVGVAQSVVVAYFFGTARMLEVYFAAAMLQLILVRLMQTGQVGEILLPIYHRIRHASGPEAARRAFSAVANWMVLLVAAASVGLWFAAPALMRLVVPGFAPDDWSLGVRMFRWLLPLVGVQVVVSLGQTLANAERWFGRPEMVGVGARSVVLVSIAALAWPLGPWAMVAALWAGHVVQLLGMAVLLYRLGYRHRLCLRQDALRVRALFAKLLVTLSYVGATQVYAVVLSAGLSLLPQGTYAVFSYVQRLYGKTNAVFLRPVSVVFFTHFSQALARGARDLRELARTALSRCLGIAVLVIVAVVVAGRPLLEALWGGQRFGEDNLVLASRLLCVFYVLLPASALGTIARKTTMSLGMVAGQYVSTGAVQLASAALAWVLIAAFDVAGATATIALNAVGLAAAPLAVLAVRRREAFAFYPASVVARWLACAAAGVGAGFAAAAVAPGLMSAVGLGGRAAQAGVAAIGGGTAVIVALVGAWLLNVYEVREFCRRVRARFAARRRVEKEAT